MRAQGVFVWVPSSGLGIQRWDCVMLNLLFSSIAFGESRFGAMNEIIYLKSGNLWKERYELKYLMSVFSNP